MAAVPFDTLKLARRLESAGFPPKQAGDTAEALADAMSGAELATKADLGAVRADLAAVKTELKAEIAALRAELKGDIAALRAELKADISALRAELKGDIAALKADIELLRRDLTIRLGSMIVVAVGILLAAIRYLPNPHP
jgi:uncharacterized protein involved in exopolysaccharide biosynthesis